MRRLLVLTSVCSLILATGILPHLCAETSPSSEKHKIEALIKHVAEMKDAKFVRNGRAHDPATAATFLRRKWEANDLVVTTARDFIEKVASVSGTSGKPYLIRFKDGSEVKSKDFLLLELRKIEKPTTNQAGTGIKLLPVTNDPPNPPR